MMIAFRTPGSEMQERMDCNYYHPRYVENSLKIGRHPCCVFASTYKQTAIGHTASVELHYSQNGIGVPFVSGKAIKAFELQTHGSERITFESHNGPLADCKLRPGYLLVVRKGEVGNACVVPESAGELSCASEVMFFEMNATDEAYFFATFFNSQPGRLAIERLQRGTIIFGVSLLDIPPLRVFWPDHKVRRYLGDKVRQAERLRERARTLEADVASIHAQYAVQPTGIDFAKRIRRLASRSLTERLDAHFYPSAVEEYFRHFNLATRSLNRLCLLVANGQSQPESAEGVRQVTVTNLRPSFVDGLMRTVQRPTDGSPTLAPHDLLLCNAAHEKSYIGRDVTYSQVDGPFPSTEVMVVRVDRTQVPASFVRHHLKTQIGYLQIQSTIRGITAHSYPTDMKLIEIPIPQVPEAQRPAWFATDDKMLDAGRCFDAAKILTTGAKVLVEAIIEDKVTEAELVAAQEALERGDNSADRALLRRLTRHGLDVPGQSPLFPDLDVLYALLAQTQEANP